MKTQTYEEWKKTKQCGTKIGFLSQMVANNFATLCGWLVDQGADTRLAGMEAYECPYCSEWHVGHPTAGGYVHYVPDPIESTERE